MKEGERHRKQDVVSEDQALLAKPIPDQLTNTCEFKKVFQHKFNEQMIDNKSIQAKCFGYLFLDINFRDHRWVNYCWSLAQITEAY